MSQVPIKVVLIVKASSDEEAAKIVRQRLGKTLNEWFESNDAVPECYGGPGYPNGSLLFWGVSSPSEPSSDPSAPAGPGAGGENAPRAVSGPANPLPAGPAAPAPAPKGWTEA